MLENIDEQIFINYTKLLKLPVVIGSTFHDEADDCNSGQITTGMTLNCHKEAYEAR